LASNWRKKSTGERACGAAFVGAEDDFSGGGTFAVVCPKIEKAASCAAAKIAATRQRA
jgi:hypothetical protein